MPFLSDRNWIVIMAINGAIALLNTTNFLGNGTNTLISLLVFIIWGYILIGLTDARNSKKLTDIGKLTTLLLFVTFILSFMITPLLLGNLNYSDLQSIHGDIIIATSILIAVMGILKKGNDALFGLTIIIASVILVLSFGSLEVGAININHGIFFLTIINVEILLIIAILRILYQIGISKLTE